MNHNVLNEMSHYQFDDITMKLSEQTHYTVIECTLIDSSWTEIVVDFVQRLNDEYEKVDAMVMCVCCVDINFVIGIVQATTFQVSVQLAECIGIR